MKHYIMAEAKCDIPLDNTIVKMGEKITLTNGKEEKYALWHGTGVYDLPEEYIDMNHKGYYETLSYLK